MKDHLRRRVGTRETEIRRGEYVGVRQGGEPVNESEHFYKCADEMKAKNARKEIPVGFMPDAGSA